MPKTLCNLKSQSFRINWKIFSRSASRGPKTFVHRDPNPLSAALFMSHLYCSEYPNSWITTVIQHLQWRPEFENSLKRSTVKHKKASRHISRHCSGFNYGCSEYKFCAIETSQWVVFLSRDWGFPSKALKRQHIFIKACPLLYTLLCT
jgi:hypothetical protein